MLRDRLIDKQMTKRSLNIRKVCQSNQILLKSNRRRMWPYRLDHLDNQRITVQMKGIGDGNISSWL